MKKKIFVYLLKLAVYAFCLSASLVLSYNLKHAFVIPNDIQSIMWQSIILFVPLKILLLNILGEFKGIFSYFRLPDLVKIVACFSGFSFIFLLLRVICDTNTWIPSREIILSDLLFSILFILFFRASVRIVCMRLNTSESNNNRPKHCKRVAIIGSNDTASQIIADLKAKPNYGIKPVAILDDNPKYYGRSLHGVPVLGVPELFQDLSSKDEIDGIVFIANSLLQKRLQTLTKLANSLNLKVFTVPSFDDFFQGRAFVSRLKPLSVEDFLARDPIKLNLENTQRLIENQVVLVTGGGGSIGSELCRQIAQKCQKQLIVIDHSEFNLFKIEQSLLQLGVHCVPVLLNVAHKEALRACFEKYRPDIVFHAAAYKHVPLLESQPLVAVKNNILSTGYLAQISSEMGVKRFILVSTDKAINPVNNMGATKRICEMICMKMQESPGNKTQFMAVRFGNVLGSAGSVLPTFQEQIARGGPITVTHPQMTRFFMTIPEAVSLILEAFSFENVAGKTFVLDMGKPIKIVDVAKHMIELNNLRVGTDIEIVYTGIRPGEKLHEDLVFDPEKILPTENQLIGVFKDDLAYLGSMKPVEDYLAEVEKLTTDEASIKFIQELIPEFKK